ncbi:MAG: GAF domain-containing protein [Thermoplasmata archaeon]
MQTEDVFRHILSELCTFLKKNNENYNWVGIYVLKSGKLELECYEGEKTDHEIISLGDGLCSLAVLKNEIVNEADVTSNPKYLACFPSTRSEIVVPIRLGGKAIGEIDIDSDRKGVFTEMDETFLSDVADRISKLVEYFYRE